MRRLARVVALVVISVLVITAVILTTLASEVSHGPVTVIIPRAVSHLPYSSNYWPSTITVVLGINNTVKWINLDDHMHTVTAIDWSFHSGELNLYDSFVFMFTEPGEYRYRCLPHPWMEGVVKVVTKN